MLKGVQHAGAVEGVSPFSVIQAATGFSGKKTILLVLSVKQKGCSHENFLHF